MDDLLEIMVLITLAILGIALCILLLFGLPNLLFGSYAVKDIEKRAPQWLSEQGFTIVAHEGFTYGLLTQPGGCVWYLMTRGDDKTVYNGCVSKWHNGELQLYGTRAVNAVSGH